MSGLLQHVSLKWILDLMDLNKVISIFNFWVLLVCLWQNDRI